MSRWFRMHDCILDDPKVQRLPSDLFKTWVNLLCIASRNSGELPPVADLAFLLRMSEGEAAKHLRSLIDADLIDDMGDYFAPHNWNERQYKTDVSTERVKRFRQRSMKRDETVSETPPDTETDTEQKQKDARAPAKPSFEIECRTLVGEEPVLVSLDFHKLQKLVDDGAVTEADVKAGISAAMAKPDFRIRHWSQLEGWARGAAKERLAGKSKTGPPVVVAMTPEDRAAAVAKVGKRWVEYDTPEWSRVADLYKAATGKFPPHPAGGWYFPESYFQKSECAA